MAIVFFLLETFSRQHLLFASLASSAFLIYMDPKHPTNGILTLVVSQITAALIGIGVLKIVGSGYASAMLAMVISIIFMIIFNVMHPPAVSTALTFAFFTGKTFPLFIIAVGILVILIIVQKISVWMINKKTSKIPLQEVLN